MNRVRPVGGLAEKVLRVVGSKKKWISAIVAVAAVGMFATVALGSHARVGFAGTTLVVGDLDQTVHWNSDRVKFQTKGATDVMVQRIVLSPGGRSGWHHHPGIVIAVVESGAVTFTQSDCSSKTYGPGLPAGDVFVEGGDDPGEASSVNGATLYATFVAPNTDPPVFRIDDHNFPGCP
jgi:quercetin dioxygenase-like cupin family protein